MHILYSMKTSVFLGDLLKEINHVIIIRQYQCTCLVCSIDDQLPKPLCLLSCAYGW